ncbi:MAG: hypothetical protein A2V81_05425 [Candidatus Abawacabacteria bacterium RBG_16_42_10]|uniref:Uncharacterized protein n=1 Tax=Candidatus Abawacabacteria bacterium RBG_16_42_10 TaxID=1817814 RepID=A0A1F4XKQ6_9BACT|nr:MAG: hypothetical protein A2V81_05425 [Candidatus Abawacabacteria bacterium RBG_16_42_10]
MPTTLSKLTFFLELATSGQQFPLIVLSDDKKVVQEQEIVAFIQEKKSMTLQKASREEMLSKIMAPKPDLFGENAPGTYTLMLIDLQAADVEHMLPMIAQIRMSGTFQWEGKEVRLADAVKFVFIITNDTLGRLPEDSQDTLLVTMSPVYRFDL